MLSVCVVLDGFKRPQVKAHTHKNRAQRIQQALCVAKRHGKNQSKFENHAKQWASFSAAVKNIIIEVMSE